MIKRYDKHHSDKILLKKIYENDENLYKKMFKNKGENLCIYEQYVKKDIEYAAFVDHIKEDLKILKQIRKK